VSLLAGRVTIVIRFLGRVPRWLSIGVALISAGSLYAIGRISSSLHGWEVPLSIAAGVVCAVAVAGQPLLDQWKGRQEARLRVELEVVLPGLGIPVYADDQNVIESMVTAEETACMASSKPERTRRRGGFDAGEVAKELDEGKPSSGFTPKSQGLSVREYEQLIEKKNLGAELTPEEDQALAEGQEALQELASSMAPIINAASAAFMRQDTRTVEQYREEVRRHLSDYADYLSERLQWEYAERGAGVLGLTLVNPTDRTFEDVQVEIYIPGQITAINLRDISQPADSAPPPPRPFGKSTMMEFDIGSFIPQHLMIPSANPVPGAVPIIDNSSSASVKYPPVRLRPRARVALDDIVLIVNEPPGSVIAGTWEATAINAEACVKGTLRVNVATTPLPVRELLTIA
jgi:hypothetical protein